jgi:hypothetical protein
MSRHLILGFGAAMLVVALGCNSSPSAPSPSSSAAPGSIGAAGDTATLKATPPTAQSPGNGDRIAGTTATFVAGTSTATFVPGLRLDYIFQILDASGNVIHESSPVAHASGNTVQYDPQMDFGHDKAVEWRVRAVSGGRSTVWSNQQAFRTELPPPPPPPPPAAREERPYIPRPAGGWPSSGPAIAALVAATYPELLQPTSFDQRIHNMEILRDLIIEAARCGGLNVARNLKRGVGPHSHDAVCWRTGGKDLVIDIASAFDDNTIPLRLGWGEVPGPPGYDPLPYTEVCDATSK